MSAAPRRVADLAGEEAIYLLEGVRLGRLVFTRRGGVTVRPGSHALQYGRLVVRAPLPVDVVEDGAELTYHVEQVDLGRGTGWAVTVQGPVELLTDAHEAAHFRRILLGWAHGPHDMLLRIHPQTVGGHRFHAPEDGPGADGRSGRPGGR